MNSRKDWEEYLSEDFDRGRRTSEDPHENSILKSYDQVRDQLRSYKTWEVDKEWFVDRVMEKCSGSKTLFPWRWPSWRVAWKPALAIVVGMVCVYFFGWLILAQDTIFIPKINLASEEEPSWFWTRDLRQGDVVTTPEDEKVTIHLYEGSRIECDPNTKLAVNINDWREIVLKRGKIKVYAAHDTKRKMIVKTPFVDVIVVGTVFTVSTY